MKNIDFKGIDLKKRGKIFGLGVSPNADWKVILITTFILMLVISAVGVYVFIRFANGRALVSEKSSNQAPPTLNVAQLKRIIVFYEEREKLFNQIKMNTDISVDPSL